MALLTSLNSRSLGFSFKKYDNLVDLKLKYLKERAAMLWDVNREHASIMALQFHPTVDYRFVTVSDDGFVSFWKTDNDLNKNFVHTLKLHQDCIYDVAWSHDGHFIYTVCGDGSLICLIEPDMVDNQSNMYKKKPTPTEPRESFKSITVKNNEPNIVAVGSSKGSLYIWDNRIPDKWDISISRAHYSKTAVRSLLFQDDNLLISSCVGEPIIKVWDLRRTYCSNIVRPKSLYSIKAKYPVTGFSSLALDPTTLTLYARSQKADIHTFDMAAQTLKPGVFLNSEETMTFHVKIKLSPDYRHLVSGSTKGYLNIWNTKTGHHVYSKTVEQLQKGTRTEEITAVDWTEYYNRTVICGGCEEGSVILFSEDFNKDPTLLDDPPSLNCMFEELDLNTKLTKRIKTPQKLCNSSKSNESPTINLPNFIANCTSHPVTKASSTQKMSRTPNNNWLDELRKKITPNRTIISKSAEKNKTSGKKSRRRLACSPVATVPLDDFIQQRRKIPKLDVDN